MSQIRSKMSCAECEARAMLLGDGWYYDRSDHTLTYHDGNKYVMHDPETLELVGESDGGAPPWWTERKRQVKEGLIGCRAQR